MARNGSGTYNRAVSPYTAGTTITAATVNQEMDDIATALTQSIARDGQASATANIPMGGFRLTGLGNAIAITDAAPLGQVLAKAGDTATGALGVIAGTAAAPGVFVSGDTNTGLFQPAADTLAVTVGGTEVARYGAGGFMRLADGTAAAPAYSFSGDTDTGIYSAGAGIIGFAHNGVKGFEFFLNNLFMDISPGTTSGQFYFRAGDASATNARIGIFATLNENNRVVADVRHNVATDGSGSIDFYATPSGDRTLDRRVLRATIPGSGAISLVGPVNVTSGALQVAGNPVQIQRGAEVATNTNQVQYDFTGIPAGVREITVTFFNVSTNGTAIYIIQLGAGSFVTSGYVASTSRFGPSSLGTTGITAGIAGIDPFTAGANAYGSIILTAHTNQIWVAQGSGRIGPTNEAFSTGGGIDLAGTLDRLRLTTVGGVNTFDAGSVNILWRF